MSPPEINLRIAGFQAESRVNGPGRRAVIWVQGCTLACPGCFNPATHDAQGPAVGVEAVVERLLAARRPGLDGLSFSGGEPFQQAPALAAVARAVRAAWPEASLLAFSGYTLESLRGPDAPAGAADLLAQLDLLLDAPFDPRDETVRPWRASGAQRLWVLGRRAPPELHREIDPPSAEIQVEPDGRVLLSGFPDPGLRRAIRELAR